MKYLIIALVLTASVGSAQVGTTVEKGATLQTGTTSNPFLRATTNSGHKIIGSEYLNEEWEQATVIDVNINKKVTLLARFNAYTKEIELLKEKNAIALNPIDGVSVILNGKTFVPVKLEDAKKPIFAERLVDGRTNLFKVYDVKIIKAPSDATLLNIDNTDKLTITDKIYYQKDEGKVLEVPTKRNAFDTILDQQTEKFRKIKKLSFKKEADLIRIFEFLNTKTESSK